MLTQYNVVPLDYLGRWDMRLATNQYNVVPLNHASHRLHLALPLTTVAPLLHLALAHTSMHLAAYSMGGLAMLGDFAD